MGMVDFVEPFAALMNQGQVINQGRAMSKSLGNGVDLGRQLSEYGVDAVRLTIVFAGPPEDDIDWADVSPGGSVKYLARVARLAEDVGALPLSEVRDVERRPRGRPRVDEVTRLVEAQRLQRRRRPAHGADHRAAQGRTTAGAAGVASLREGTAALAVMLGCFAPYTAEEVWSRLGHDVDAGDSVHDTAWPVADPALLVQESVTCVVQVAGKVRDRLEVPPGIGEDELRELALASEAVAARAGRPRRCRTSSCAPPKLVNVVPA